VGARPLILEIAAPKNGDSLDAWEKAANQPKATTSELLQFVNVSSIISGPRAAAVLNITPSDSDGWFNLRGLGKDRIAGVQLSGTGIESSLFHVRTRPGQTYKLFRDPHQRTVEENYYPETFTHVAAPSQPVIGQVTDAPTGQPIAGCV